MVFKKVCIFLLLVDTSDVVLVAICKDWKGIAIFQMSKQGKIVHPKFLALTFNYFKTILQFISVQFFIKTFHENS